MKRLALWTVCGGLIAAPTAALAQPEASADLWVTNAVQFPPGIAGAGSTTNGFATLQARFLAGKLKVLWGPERVSKSALVIAYASAQELGHWPARDWRPFPMVLRGDRWEAAVPVEDLDVPLVYFAEAREGVATNLSAMRVFSPRAAGMEEPTRVFWPFLEGFELGLESWQLLGPRTNSPSLTQGGPPKNGLVSLVVPLAANQRSVTVVTTRVRGWQIQREGATGIGVWLRTRTGVGQARFTLKANAFTTNQVASVFKKAAALDEQWRKVDLWFADLAPLPWRGVDLFTIEFIGQGPREFLMDDLHLLGPWKLDIE